MTEEEKIIQVLTTYLNREPYPNEIINAQSDPRIMMWVNQIQ
jgi:hypothetical protein